MRFIRIYAMILSMVLIGGCKTSQPVPIETPPQAANSNVPTAPTPLPGGSSSPIQTESSRMIGLTIDDVSNLSAIVSMLKSLPKKPWVRIVFDENVKAKEYKDAVKAIHPLAFIMGELLDSEFVEMCSQDCYEKRTKEYLAAFPEVDLWELGNEINGNWLGKNAWAKSSASLKLAKLAGKKTAITFYLEQDLGMFQWASKNLSAQDKLNIDYVFISYYLEDNKEWHPDWSQIFITLGAQFPSAKLGIGECGRDPKRWPQAKAKEEFKFYYKDLNVTHSRFVGGFFWWYTKELIGKDAFLLDDFKAAM